MFSSDEEPEWKGLLAESFGCQYWRTRIEQYKQIDSTRTDFRASFNQAIETLSTCLCMSWIDEAKTLTDEIKILYERQRYFETGHYPLYHWLLRICFDHWDIPFDAWSNPDEDTPHSLNQPVLNELFVHWRGADLLPMQERIQWLCDFYAHRTRRKQWYEFSNSHLLTRFPALILAWQRLREIRGLENRAFRLVGACAVDSRCESCCDLDFRVCGMAGN